MSRVNQFGIVLVIVLLVGVVTFMSSRRSATTFFEIPTVSSTTLGSDSGQQLQHQHQPPQQVTVVRQNTDASSKKSSSGSSNAVVPPCLVLDDQQDFVLLTHTCSDKTTTHHFEGLYARALYRYRHTEYAVARGEKKYSMLEMGVGCSGTKCYSGGYRTFRRYIPQLAYHGIDINLASCLISVQRAQMTAMEAAYLSSHTCFASNQDLAALQKCSDRFGPFEVIVDDASHFQSHVTNTYELLFHSPMLNNGGYYIVEDLDSAFSSEARYEGLEEHQRANKTFPFYVRNMIACWVLGDCDGYPAVTKRNTNLIDTIAVFHESVYLRKAFDETTRSLPQAYIDETPGCLHDVMAGLAEGPDRHPGMRIQHAVTILDFYGACKDPKSAVIGLCTKYILPLLPTHRISSFEELASASTSAGYKHNGDPTTIGTIMKHAVTVDGAYVLLTFNAAVSHDEQEKVITHIVAMLNNRQILAGTVFAIVGLKQGGHSSGGPLLTFLYDMMFMMLSYSPQIRMSRNVQGVVPPKYEVVRKLVLLVGEVTFVCKGEIAYITKVPMR